MMSDRLDYNDILKKKTFGKCYEECLFFKRFFGLLFIIKLMKIDLMSKGIPA